MSTATIRAVWEHSEIIGVDLSGEMLDKAKKVMPEITFIQRDCGESLSDMGSFDLIFSNAFLQWIPNQEEFIRNSFGMLNQGGCFAAQIPLFSEMPVERCIIEAEDTFSQKFNDIERCRCYSAADYYDMMSKYTDNSIMWVTDYYHELNDYEGILEFLKGAALRPYLEKLEEEEQAVFLAVVLKNIKKTYSQQENGKVLFPFKRLFLVGIK